MNEPHSPHRQPFNITNVNNCTVMLLDHSNQIQIDKVKNSKVFVGPCCESVFIRDCRDCVFTVACKQLRTRDCVNCVFNLYVACASW